MSRDLVTYPDRLRCFLTGHDVHGWGTITGHCRRCHHAVWTHDGRSVLLGGTFHPFPPPHTADSERRLIAMGYTPGGVPERPELDALALPRFTRREAKALAGGEDQYLADLEGER